MSPRPIEIWAARDVGSKILRTVELPAKSSVHINMQQDFTQRAAELQSLRDRVFGGFFIRAESPTAQILVKEHIFSQSRQVASPYYGSVDILISHHIQSYPPQMVAGQNATAQTMACYYSGCYWNGWQISSFHPSIVSTQWLPGWVPRPITAHQPGIATLHSSAQGPINQHGDLGWKDDAVIISVYDATPVINAIVPNTIPVGGSQIVEIWGLNFGSNPTVHAGPGITVGTRVYASNHQINVWLTHNPGFPPGQYNVWVTSSGFSGSGFLQAPGGGSQAQSGPKQVGVVTLPIIPVTLRAFIMPHNVGPDPFADGGACFPSGLFFAGDDRSFQQVTQKYRVSQVINANGQYPASIGVTKTFATNSLDQQGNIGMPALADVNQPGSEGDCSLWHRSKTADASGLSGSRNSLTGTVTLQGSIGNPLQMASPHIDWTIAIEFDFSNPQNVKARATGIHDCFPAYEIYVGNTLIHHHTPSGHSIVHIGNCLAALPVFGTRVTVNTQFTSISY